MKKKKICACCLGTGTEQDPAAVGQMLKRWRRRSLREVAQRMGITASHLSYLENGKRNWSPALVEKYKESCR